MKPKSKDSKSHPVQANKPAPGKTQTSIVRAEMRTEMYEGPLPHPSILAQYNSVIPGLGEKIIEAWIAETDKRHKIADREQDRYDTIVKARHREEVFRIFVTAMAVLIPLGGGAFLVATGQYKLGASLLGSPFVYGAISLIRGKASKDK